MRNITKAKQAKFAKAAKAFLIEKGATATNVLGYELALPTAIGNLYIKLDAEADSSLFSIFGNFVGNEDKAKDALGHWKYNFHVSDNIFEVVLASFQVHIFRVLNLK